MKFSLPKLSVVLVTAAFAMNANAQDPTCANITWSAAATERLSTIADYCLGMEQEDGAWYAKFKTRVVRQNPTSTTVKFQRPDGTWSQDERMHPDISSRAELENHDVLISELGQGTEVSVYVIEEGNFTAPAPVAAAATSAPASAPAAAPAAAPEPAPAMLPKTAGQANWLAILGTLLILVSAGFYVRRQF